MAYYTVCRMDGNSFSLNELAELTGIEARTIRSYIERGLLPGAETRGRGASYSAEHLDRLRAIQGVRRARPNITLSDIRILLQQLKPQQINRLASGSITAVVSAMSESASRTVESAENHSEEGKSEPENDLGAIDWSRIASSMTGVERLVRLLREVSGTRSLAPKSKVQQWARIAVTPDFELSVRADFDETSLVAFRELADLLRHLFENTYALQAGSHDQ